MYCAIDFGTSNSAIAIPDGEGLRLVDLEAGATTMPTAVFYLQEGREDQGPPRAFGRAALAAYVEGTEGRLMRSMKSILGSSLVDQVTEVGGGRGVKYLDVISGYLKHLKTLAERQAGQTIHRVVMGRPVFFVDDDAVRDAQAQASLEAAARSVGFEEVVFQYEPLAAAFDFEQSVASGEQRVLVADIGGGTSDFSVVRVGPERSRRLDRAQDILANHGVHVAGTDFDRRVELASVLPEFGFGALGPSIQGSTPKEVPSKLYFDLSTWHLINTVYSPQRVAEIRAMHSFYGNPAHHRRLMTVITERLGHELASKAEWAKIEVAKGSSACIDLAWVERGLTTSFTEQDAVRVLAADIERIVQAARETVQQAGLSPAEVDALYFTGGSTGLRLLSDHIAQAFPGARAVTGDRFASVAKGLGLAASRCFGTAA